MFTIEYIDIYSNIHLIITSYKHLRIARLAKRPRRGSCRRCLSDGGRAQWSASSRPVGQSRWLRSLGRHRLTWRTLRLRGGLILVEGGDFKDSVLGISGRYQTSTDVDICRLYYLYLWDDAPQFRVSFRGLESTNQLRFVGALDGTMRFSLVFIQRMDE